MAEIFPKRYWSISKGFYNNNVVIAGSYANSPHNCISIFKAVVMAVNPHAHSIIAIS